MNAPTQTPEQQAAAAEFLRLTQHEAPIVRVLAGVWHDEAREVVALTRRIGPLRDLRLREKLTGELVLRRARVVALRAGVLALEEQVTRAAIDAVATEKHRLASEAEPAKPAPDNVAST